MIKKIFTAKQIYEGAEIPRGYGVAYNNPLMRYAVAYPIPINLLVRMHRKLHYLIVIYKPSQREKDIQKAWLDGYHKGFARGKNSGRS